MSNARSAWAAAGFTGPFSPEFGHNNKIVLTQNELPGSCKPPTIGIVVTNT